LAKVATSAGSIVRTFGLTGLGVSTGFTDRWIPVTTTAAGIVDATVSTADLVAWALVVIDAATIGIVDAAIVPTDLGAGALIVITATVIHPRTATGNALFTRLAVPSILALALIVVLATPLEALLPVKAVVVVDAGVGVGIHNTGPISTNLVF